MTPALPREDGTINDLEHKAFCKDSAGEIGKRICLDADAANQIAQALKKGQNPQNVSVYSFATTPGSEQTIVSFTVPASNKFCPQSVNVSCQFQSKYRVLAGGSLIGSGRIGNGSPAHTILFTKTPDVIAGATVEIRFTQEFGPIDEVDATLMGDQIAV